MYNTFIFKPLYNGLVGIMDVLPWVDIGVAVIIFTIVVRLILFPLSKSALLTQVRMKEVEGDVNKLKAQYGSNRQTQALKVMELYKSHNIKPFSGVLLLIVQLPILIGLISVFYKITPAVHPELLYSFIHVPVVTMTLFGLSIAGKSFILSLITGIAQFLQLNFSIAARQQKKLSASGVVPGTDFASAMSSSMTTQMKYILPLLAFASTYWIIPVKFPEAASIIA
ncbi:MAG: YidC/Oxa1 family membrane protein insertase, partial [Candidatus Taylorbacteria bacterium]